MLGSSCIISSLTEDPKVGLSTRGLRQGNHFSPFLFLLAVDFLSRLVLRGVKKSLNEGFQVGKEKVSSSHFQVDDITFFCSGKKRVIYLLLLTEFYSSLSLFQG